MENKLFFSKLTKNYLQISIALNCSPDHLKQPLKGHIAYQMVHYLNWLHHQRYFHKYRSLFKFCWHKKMFYRKQLCNYFLVSLNYNSLSLYTLWIRGTKIQFFIWFFYATIDFFIPLFINLRILKIWRIFEFESILWTVLLSIYNLQMIIFNWRCLFLFIKYL